MVADDLNLLLVPGRKAALLVQGLLEGDQFGDVPNVGDHQADLVVLIINGGAGDQGLLAGDEGLVGGVGVADLQGLKGGGVGDEAPADQFIHGDTQHVPGGQAGDDLIGMVDPDGYSLAVGDENAIEGALQNGEEAGQGGQLAGYGGKGGVFGEIDAVAFHEITSLFCSLL